jgi:hypothetical protein
MQAMTTDITPERTWKKSISATARNRIEAQGFLGYDDTFLADINYWLRLAPFLCMTWAAVGTYLAKPLVVWALVPFALLGAVLPGHPFDVIYNYGIRHLTGTPALPRYGKPRRSACAVMAVWAGATGWAFFNKWMAAGDILGSVVVLLALINVTTGFCVPSFFYGLIFGKQQTQKTS